jgi:hypothetical protein
MFCFYTTKQFFATAECNTWLPRPKDVLLFCSTVQLLHFLPFSSTFMIGTPSHWFRKHDYFLLSKVVLVRFIR